LESKDEKSKAIQFPFKNFKSLHTEFQSLKARKQYTPFGTFLPDIVADPVLYQQPSGSGG
jgi:hypothetical protein